MPTETATPNETHKLGTRVVELVERYHWHDACRIRCVATGAEMIVSFAELRPHRTREKWISGMAEARKRAHQEFIDKILDTIDGKFETLSGIAKRLGRPKRKVSKAVRELQIAGKVTVNWTTRPFRISLVEQPSNRQK